MVAPVIQSLDAQALAPTACTTIEEVGSTGVGALTIAFLIFAISTIIFIARVGNATVQKQFYYCCIFICGLSTISYFAMLSGQGWTAIAGCRQFFYARYFSWFLTSPLIILALGLVAGADVSTIAATIGAVMISVFSGYMASVAVVTTVKWFWFVISLATLIPVLYGLGWNFRSEAVGKGSDIADVYGRLAWLTIIVWIFGPLVWLFSEGFASFSVSFEVVVYSLLDIVGKAIFGFIIMGSHETLGNPGYISPAIN